MRVTVNHSIELEDVPKYVVDVIDKINFDDIDECLRGVSKNLSSEHDLNAIMFYVSGLMKAKKRLADIEAMTNDCASILSGYVKVKNEMLAEQAKGLLSKVEESVKVGDNSSEKEE